MPRSRNRNKQKYNPKSTTRKKKLTRKVEPIILGDYVFPIYGLRHVDNKLIPFEIHGTCFYIGNSYFLTALHVAEYAKASEDRKIGFFSQTLNGCVNMSSYEVVEEFPESDIALIKSEEILKYDKKPKAFKWSGKELLIFEEVRSMGYPHGFDSTRGMSIGRGFSGTILSEIPFERDNKKATCYELSFQAPRGLSGGLLLDKSYNVHGIVIGNSEKEINVFFDETTIFSGDQKTIKTEIANQKTFIGIAITERHIFKIFSSYLNKTFHDYLIESSLH